MTAWIGFDRMLKMSSFCIFWLVYLSLSVTVLVLISTFKVLISHLFCSGMGHNHYAKEIQRNGLLFGSSSDTGLFNFHSISSNDYASCLCHSIFNAF
jgi:hypothetical protein